MEEPRIDGILERHRAFWDRSGDAALIGIDRRRSWNPKPYPLTKGRTITDPLPIDADDMDVERLLGLEDTPHTLFTGDFINSLGPLYPNSWLEGVIGCPIFVSAYGCVARPAGIDLREAIERVSTDVVSASPWARVMDRVRAETRRRAGARYPVDQLHLRGVVDLLAAFLGEETLCAEMYDRPAEIDRFARLLTDIWVLAAQRDGAQRNPWRGGWVSCWGIWAPERLVDYQLDASSLFSADQYRRFFLEWDRRSLSPFPYSVTHLHACGLHHLDALLEVEGIRAVQISLDRETNAWDMDAVIRSCRKIQSKGRCVILTGELEAEELKSITEALAPGGLAILASQ